MSLKLPYLMNSKNALKTVLASPGAEIKKILYFKIRYDVYCKNKIKCANIETAKKWIFAQDWILLSILYF